MNNDMTDEQLEMRLRRYRPAAPDAALGPRVLAAAAAPRRVPLRALDWGLVATAAMLFLAAAWTTPDRVAAPPSAADEAWRNEVALVASTLPGDNPERIAEILVPRPAPALVLPTSPEAP
jgi:hypothetical protein